MSRSTKTISSVYAVVGKERFLRNEAVERILRELDQESGDVGTTHVVGDQANLADVLDEVRTPSLLGGMRAVVVDEADDFISKHRSILETYCAAPSDSGCLVLLCDSLPKTTRLYKVIAEQGSIIVCEPPKGRSLNTWLADRAKTIYGKRLAEPAAGRLREHIGEAVGALDAELGKLAAYVGQRSDITPNDVDAVTGHHREENVFAVTDAIAEGDAPRALHHWEQVLATDRAAPGRAIGGLAWAVRRLLDARRAWQGGANVRALAGRMFTDADILERRLRRVTVANLEEQLSDLLDADLALKTGGSTIELAVEKFIVKHAAKSAPEGTLKSTA